MAATHCRFASGKYHQRTFGLDDTRLVSLTMMDGLTCSAGTVGVDKPKGAKWHEQLISFLMKHNLSVFHNLHAEAKIDSAKQQHIEQFTVTVHHLALLYIGLYKLSTGMLSTCFLSDVLLIEGCLAGLDVDAMVCILTQGDGWILKGRTGCVRFATHLRTSRMSSISCLVAQLTVM